MPLAKSALFSFPLKWFSVSTGKWKVEVEKGVENKNQLSGKVELYGFSQLGIHTSDLPRGTWWEGGVGGGRGGCSLREGRDAQGTRYLYAACTIVCMAAPERWLSGKDP